MSKKLIIKEEGGLLGSETHLWDSALIKATTYFPAEQKLIIEFSNSSTYLYKEFAQDIYKEFVEAESKGKFFCTTIKKLYSDNEKVEKLSCIE